MAKANEIIVVEIKTVYGEELVYPVCRKARIFAKLCNTKTLTPSTIAQIRELGYAVKVATPTLKG